MEPTRNTPEQILTQAVSLRAAAYRRWCDAARTAPTKTTRSLYESLAAMECDRYEELMRRFLGARPGDPRPPREPSPFPHRLRRRQELRAAVREAEAESRAWTEQLRSAGRTAPERVLLTALLEDARRVQQHLLR